MAHVDAAERHEQPDTVGAKKNGHTCADNVVAGETCKFGWYG